MLAYYLQQALRSLRRNPAYSMLMMLCLALGVGVWISVHSTVASQARDPMPGPRNLFHVELEHDSGLPERMGNAAGIWGLAHLPDLLLSYRQVSELSRSQIPSRSAGAFSTQVAVQLDDGRFVEGPATFCFADLFALFEIPVLSGSTWARSLDLDPNANVAVVDHDQARLWFGKTDPIGRKVRLGGVEVTISGVAASDPQRLRLYHLWFGGGYRNGLFLPLGLIERMRARPVFVFGWSDHDGASAALRTLDDGFVHFWVELPTEAQRSAMILLLDSYVERERVSGRASAPLRPTLRRLDDWRRNAHQLYAGYRLVEMLSLIGLIASCLSLVRLLMAKFQIRAPEVSVRRALGASRRAVFLQHIVEALLVGVGGALIGLLFASLEVAMYNAALPDRTVDFALDLGQVASGFGVTLLCALFAGLYPAWRICSIPPAVYLRWQ